MAILLPPGTSIEQAVEEWNTIEAYTFLARHILLHFPQARWRIWRWRPSHVRPGRVLRHALGHLTAER